MLGIKNYLREKRYLNKLDSGCSADKFPDKPIASVAMWAKFELISNLLSLGRRQKELSALRPNLSKAGIAVWSKLIRYNPNNHGLMSHGVSADLEKSVVDKVADLFVAKKQNLTGYVTSGGTESNIFSAWIGRKYLQSLSIDTKNIRMFVTSLSHHSLLKASDIVGIQVSTIPLNEDTWGIDVSSFREEVQKAISNGCRGFLVPLTLGYSVTGSSDPYAEICKEVRNLKRRYKVDFFLWIDAAFSGLTMPFLVNKFTPFLSPEIMAFSTDFHKCGFAPIPSGLILFRKKLLKYVSRDVDYLGIKDATLLGSRPGLSAVAVWFIIHSMGKKGFNKSFRKSHRAMLKFAKTCNNTGCIKVKMFPGSLNCAIVADNIDEQVRKLSLKYGLDFRSQALLFNNGTKKLYLSKAFFC